MNRDVCNLIKDNYTSGESCLLDGYNFQNNKVYLYNEYCGMSIIIQTKTGVATRGINKQILTNIIGSPWYFENLISDVVEKDFINQRIA